MARMKLKLKQPRFVAVLVTLLLILVLAPVFQQAAHPGMTKVLALLGLIVPVLAVAAASEAGRPKTVAIGLAALCAFANADVIARASGLPPQVGVAILLAFLAYTTTRLLAGVVRSREVTLDVIAGAVASYMMIGLTWAIGYGLLETVRPGSIRLPEGSGASLDFPTALYFSYITLLSIGYGDITPLSATARMMVVLEGLLGMTFTTVILAVLVSAHLQQRGGKTSDGR
jgi:voltage-gated potassium channel